ncbi:hypothetical protein EJB05_15656, partial [Eragrostis curvula]
MEKVVIPSAVVVVLLLLLPPPFSAARTVPSDNCTRICGNISIPYPFGIEPGCYHAGGFNLTCSLINHTVHGHAQHRLFLGDGTVQVLKISIPANTIRINSPRVMLKDYGGYTINGTWGTGLPEGGPYALAESVNSVAVVGCNVQVDLRGGVNNGLLGSCSAVCPIINTPDGPAQITRIGHKCAGVGCCQAKNILEYSFYHIEIHMPDMNNTADATDSIAVYLADGVVDYTDNMTLYSFPHALPATLGWVISNSTCPADGVAPECRSVKSYCQNTTVGRSGYMCYCSSGYQGNPYVAAGCKGIILIAFSHLNILQTVI